MKKEAIEEGEAMAKERGGKLDNEPQSGTEQEDYECIEPEPQERHRPPLEVVIRVN